MSSTSSRDEVFLLLKGQPPAHEFVRFIRTRAVDHQDLDEHALMREWREGNARIRALETEERGVAEVPELAPLPRSLHCLADEKLQDDLVQHCLGFLPSAWAMVELDKLIVWQHYVHRDFSEYLKGRISPRPTDEELMRIALGETRTAPPVQTTAGTQNNFTFSSSSNDLRVLGAVPLRPDSVVGYRPYGRAMSVLAVFIGYGINIMHAVRFGTRLLLVNGTHRAYALRAAGVTHAPCIVLHAATREDLNIAGIPNADTRVERCFQMPRPPLLKDYFDPTLHKAVPVPRSRHVVQLEMEFRKSRIPIE